MPRCACASGSTAQVLLQRFGRPPLAAMSSTLGGMSSLGGTAAVGEVPHTAFTLGDARLHLLHTAQVREATQRAHRQPTGWQHRARLACRRSPRALWGSAHTRGGGDRATDDVPRAVRVQRPRWGSFHRSESRSKQQSWTPTWMMGMR